MAQSGHPDHIQQCSGVKRTLVSLSVMSAFDLKRTLQSRCALRIWDRPARTIESGKAIGAALDQNETLRYAWAGVGCPSIKPATGPADIFSCGGGGERSL